MRPIADDFQDAASWRRALRFLPPAQGDHLPITCSTTQHTCRQRQRQQHSTTQESQLQRALRRPRAPPVSQPHSRLWSLHLPPPSSRAAQATRQLKQQQQRGQQTEKRRKAHPICSIHLIHPRSYRASADFVNCSHKQLRHQRSPGSSLPLLEVPLALPSQPQPPPLHQGERSPSHL